MYYVSKDILLNFAVYYDFKNTITHSNYNTFDVFTLQSMYILFIICGCLIKIQTFLQILYIQPFFTNLIKAFYTNYKRSNIKLGKC